MSHFYEWRLISWIVLSMAILMAARDVFAADPANLAGELARLRTEVEELASDVESSKSAMREQLRSYAAQKADLEMELAREELRLRQLREAKAKRIERMADDNQRNELLKPVIARSAGFIEKSMLAGLPFQKSERIEAVKRIEKKNREGLLRSADAVSRLWDRVEDELRLSRENGVYRQVIRLEGEDLLVDVARVGMVMIYFKTKDGRVGRAERLRDGWTYRQLYAKEEKEQIFALFDSFKKQIRSGFFLLPGAAKSTEEKR